VNLVFQFSIVRRRDVYVFEVRVRVSRGFEAQGRRLGGYMVGSGKWLQMSGAGFAKGRICDSRRKGAEVWRCGEGLCY
jgi:hypothetical protein